MVCTDGGPTTALGTKPRNLVRRRNIERTSAQPGHRTNPIRVLRQAPMKGAPASTARATATESPDLFLPEKTIVPPSRIRRRKATLNPDLAGRADFCRWAAWTGPEICRHESIAGGNLAFTVNSWRSTGMVALDGHVLLDVTGARCRRVAKLPVAAESAGYGGRRRSPLVGRRSENVNDAAQTAVQGPRLIACAEQISGLATPVTWRAQGGTPATSAADHCRPNACAAVVSHAA